MSISINYTAKYTLIKSIDVCAYKYKKVKIFSVFLNFLGM